MRLAWWGGGVIELKNTTVADSRAVRGGPWDVTGCIGGLVRWWALLIIKQGWLYEEGVGRVQSDKASGVSYFVVDVSRTLRRHLLDDVDRVAIVSTNLLVVWAVG